MAAKSSALMQQNKSSSGKKQRELTALPSYFCDASTDDFNRLIYERIRLGIMSALLANNELSFSELKTLLKTSDGNLSVHARKLEQAGYISCDKILSGRFPKTIYQLTSQGRQVFARYLDHMEALIRIARSE